MIKIKEFFKRNYVYIITIVLFTFWIGALFLIDYRAKELHDQKEDYIQELEEKVEKLQKQVNEYEEIIDKVEEEVGIIEDLKYQIEGYDITLVRKMHELEKLESQIAEKQAGLDALNN